jgi:hypothetical protein
MREQMIRGMARLINIDKDTAVITRHLLVDNGRGSMIPGAEIETHEVVCRVSYESGGVWKNGVWVGGLATDATPYVLASHDADIAEDDVLTWRGKSYTVGAVTKPTLGGGAVCLQAALVEVKNG